MAKDSKDVVIRKLPLPLQIKLGNDTVVTDGFFSVTSKEASQVNVTSVGEDGYVTLEIFPIPKQKTVSAIATLIESDTMLGVTTSKTRGGGKDFGQYKFYKRPDGSLYAVISGKRSRRIQLGKPSDKDGRIVAIARAIAVRFGPKEFSKKELVPAIPKHLSHGQILKALLDVMQIEGYLEKREVPIKGKSRELFKATDKLNELLYRQFRTSLESVRPAA